MFLLARLEGLANLADHVELRTSLELSDLEHRFSKSVIEFAGDTTNERVAVSKIYHISICNTGNLDTENTIIVGASFNIGNDKKLFKDLFPTFLANFIDVGEFSLMGQPNAIA